MKKRAWALLMMLAILVSMVVVPTYAADIVKENATDLADLCPCGCGEKLQDVEWKVWAENPSAGHYYLDNDYVQADQVTVLSDTETTSTENYHLQRNFGIIKQVIAIFLL